MMFTIRKKINILHDDDLITAGTGRIFRKGLVQHLCQFMIRIIHAGKDFLIHFGYPFWCFHQAFPVGIVPESNEDSPYMFFYGFRINHIRHPVSPDPR